MGPVELISGSGPVHTSNLSENEMIRVLDQSLEKLKDQPMLIQAAVFHFIFCFVHPFYDGNGRLARFIAQTMLTQKLEPYGLLQLSSVIYKNKRRYYKTFELCENSLNMADLTPFVIVFLEFVLDAFDQAIHQLTFQDL